MLDKQSLKEAGRVGSALTETRLGKIALEAIQRGQLSAVREGRRSMARIALRMLENGDVDDAKKYLQEALNAKA